MKVCLVAVAVVAGCVDEREDGPGDALNPLPGSQVVFSDAFDQVEAHWQSLVFSGFTLPVHDTAYGMPEPSMYFGNAGMATADLLDLDGREVDVRMDVFVQPDVYGDASASLALAPDVQIGDDQGYVAINMIWNQAVDTPVRGYPAGYTTNVVCGSGRELGATLAVEYDPSTGATLQPYVTIDSSGFRCGVDATVVFETTSLTAIATDNKLRIGGWRNTQSWFDNVVVRRRP